MHYQANSQLRKLLYTLHPRRWSTWLAGWGAIAVVALASYELLLAPRMSTYPELGISHCTTYGNTAVGVENHRDHVQYSFRAAPAGSGVGGGFIHGSVLAYVGRNIANLDRRFRYFDDTPLDGATHLRLRIRGKRGGERVWLSLRNAEGEGRVRLGDDWSITRSFQDLEIPLEEFERPERAAMGDAFDRNEGLDALVFTVDDNLDLEQPTELYVAAGELTGRPRGDLRPFWIAGLGLFVVFTLIRVVYIRLRLFRVFVSFAGEDRDCALEIERGLAERGFDVTRLDRARPKVGDEFTERIADAIRRSQTMVLVASANSARSQFVGIELGVKLTYPSLVSRVLDVRLRRRRLASAGAILVYLDGSDRDHIPEPLRTTTPIVRGEHIPEQFVAYAAGQILTRG